MAESAPASAMFPTARFHPPSGTSEDLFAAELRVANLLFIVEFARLSNSATTTEAISHPAVYETRKNQVSNLLRSQRFVHRDLPVRLSRTRGTHHNSRRSNRTSSRPRLILASHRCRVLFLVHSAFVNWFAHTKVSFEMGPTQLRDCSNRFEAKNRLRK